MAWFNKHPNWTAFIIWLLMNGLAYWGYSIDNFPIVITAIAIILISLAWNIWVKKRNLFYLFLVLIPYVGMFLIWGLEDKRATKKAMEKELNENMD